MVVITNKADKLGMIPANLFSKNEFGDIFFIRELDCTTPTNQITKRLIISLSNILSALFFVDIIFSHLQIASNGRQQFFEVRDYVSIPNSSIKCISKAARQCLSHLIKNAGKIAKYSSFLSAIHF